jgi:DNA-binding MarR family transcriptional regulator
MEDFTNFVCFVLKSTMKKVEKHLVQGFEEFGISVAQSFILFALLEKDGSTLTEIGNRAQIENSSLTTMVDKLEKDALVERRLDPTDRRIVRLFLTEQGKELAERVLAAGADFNRYLRAELKGVDDHLVEGLGVISRALEK